MQKVDIAIGVIGLVALIATGLGVAFYDELNDIQSYRVEEFEESVSAPAESAENSVEREFVFPTPDNATGATFEVTVTADTSTAPTATGDVAVALVLTGPDGSEERVTGSFPYSEGSRTFTIALDGWTDVPDDFDGARTDLAGKTTTWEDDIHLGVIVEGDSATGQIPIGQAQPTFTAEVKGTIHYYAAVPDLPDGGVE